MKRTIAILAVATLSAACGDSPTTPTSVAGPLPVAAVGDTSHPRLQPKAECSGTTYVGPIRLPISVHGTTVYLSWLGSDDAIRGYGVEFDISVNNVWVPVVSTSVTSPEIEYHFRTPGTYRVRVRGLFCNNGIGPFTDYVVFSTDGDAPNDPPRIVITDPFVPPPPVDPPSGGGPTPPVDDGNNGHGNDDDHNDDSNPGGGGGNNCHLNLTSNPHNGDHNDDGHNDCGIGHQH